MGADYHDRSTRSATRRPLITGTPASQATKAQLTEPTSRPTRQEETAAQFSEHAAGFASAAAHFSAESLKLIGELASVAHYKLAIDVATGPGFTAFEVAPYCDLVIATDPAEGMLEQVRRIAKERGLDNVEALAAYADALPVDDAAADLITCRTAPHHFPSVTDFLDEVARAVKPGGTFILADTSAPEDDDLDAWMNDMEQRRDRTHVRDLKHSEWRALLAEAGFNQNFEATTHVHMNVRDWSARTGVSDTDLEAIIDTWRSAPEPVIEAFQINRAEGPREDYSFSWPVFVTRTTKT